MSREKFLEAGVIINKRGLSGELKIENLCDSPEVLCSLKEVALDSKGNDVRKVLSAKTYKGFVYLKLSDIDDAEKADALRNKSIYADRESLPLSEGDVFIADIIGISVFDADSGRNYGKVTDVENHGATDIYTITNGERTYYIPAVPEIVVKIDIDTGILIRPIPGMIEDAEEIR